MGRASGESASIDSGDRREGNLLDVVRERCALVVAEASLVTIDHERLAAYAPSLVAVEPDGTDADDDPWAAPLAVGARPGPGTDERRAALVITLDAINFGSGYHPHVAKVPGLSGARTMARRLRTWEIEEGTIRADRLAALTADDAHRIFDQPRSDEMIELMALFARSLNELGRTVADRHGGSFVQLVASAEHSAAALVATLAALGTYADVSTYAGFEVPFLKRAQITVADLHRAFAGSGPGAFDDIDDLTAFADNLVPHVLRVDGVLLLDPELDRAIAAGELLVHGDPPEVELRAGAVHVVELLRGATEARGAALTSARIDQILWARGGGPRYKAIARPRARASAY